MSEQETDAPITYSFFQQLMNQLGYGMMKIDTHPRVHWSLDQSPDPALKLDTEKMPKRVVTLCPDFRAKGYVDYVYDSDYVARTIERITGQDGGGGGIYEILIFLKRSH